GGDRRRHAHAVPARALSRSRPFEAAGPARRRARRPLRAHAAARIRRRGDHGAAGRGVVMAMNAPQSQPQAWDDRSSGPRTARAVFLDTDGTRVHDVPYNVDPDRIALLPGVGEPLRTLQDAGFLLFVVSNQPGVALGRFPASALDAVEARLDELLAPFGVMICAY